MKLACIHLITVAIVTRESIEVGGSLLCSPPMLAVQSCDLDSGFSFAPPLCMLYHMRAPWLSGTTDFGPVIPYQPAFAYNVLVGLASSICTCVMGATRTTELTLMARMNDHGQGTERVVSNDDSQLEEEDRCIDCAFYEQVFGTARTTLTTQTGSSSRLCLPPLKPCMVMLLHCQLEFHIEAPRPREQGGMSASWPRLPGTSRLSPVSSRHSSTVGMLLLEVLVRSQR